MNTITVKDVFTWVPMFFGMIFVLMAILSIIIINELTKSSSYPEHKCINDDLEDKIIFWSGQIGGWFFIVVLLATM